MTGETLTVWDLEELCSLAEEVIIRLRDELAWYDDQGNRLFDSLSGKEREEFASSAAIHDLIHRGTNYLDFRSSGELHRLSFSDALELPLDTIKETYLKDILPKARHILRKDSLLLGRAPSDEIPDSYLDDLLALRWREGLRLWAIQWDDRKEKKKIEGSLIDLSSFIWTEQKTGRSVFLVTDSEIVEYRLTTYFQIYCGNTRIDDGNDGSLRIYLALCDREDGYTLERAERFIEDRDGERVLDLMKIPDEISGIPLHKMADPQRALESEQLRRMRKPWESGAFRREPENPKVWRLKGYSP